MKKLVARISLAELKEKRLVRVPYPPYDVLVTFHEGRVAAMEDACNHAGASLSEGWIEGDCVICPVHAYAFELSSGKLLRPKGLCADQRPYEATIEADSVAIYDTFHLTVLGPGAS